MTIVDGLGLEADAVAGAVNDAGGEPLAILLKAMRLDETQAQQVFLLASPVGRNVQAFFPLTDLYAGMEQSTAQTLCDAWRLSVSVRGAGYEPHLAENGERRRSTAHESPRRDEGEDLARRA